MGSQATPLSIELAFLAEAQEILHRHRIEKLPLVDDNGLLKGLITYTDILKKLVFPLPLPPVTPINLTLFSIYSN